MAVVRYCIINSSTGLCVNVINWDNTNTYYPPSGFIIAGDNTGEIGQTYSSGASPGGTWTAETPPTYPEESPEVIPVLTIEQGGTGADNIFDAQFNLGLASAATYDVATDPYDVPFTLIALDINLKLPPVDGSQLLNVPSSPVGSVIAYAGLNAPSGWLLCQGQSVSRTTYAALFAALSKNSTVTITIATPGVVSWTAHGLVAGDPVTFNTTGALPTGITAGTTYYVIATGLTADTFRISATVGGAAVNTSGTQSGTHTAYNVPYGVASATNFNIPDLRGRTTAGKDNMGGSAANRITSGGSGILGTVLGNAGGAETHSLSIAQLASHNHTLPNASGGANGVSTNTGGVGTVNTGSTGSGSAHNNTQPTMMMNYIIKT